MSEKWRETYRIKSFQESTVSPSRLIPPGIATGLIYRGQSDSTKRLTPTLDRGVPKGSSDSDRRKDEEEIVQRFYDRALLFLGDLERVYMDLTKTDRMAVMRHFGAPARLLDWTHSVEIAAYFACVYDSEIDGRIWWINAKALECYCDSHWKGWGIRRRSEDPKSEIILDDVLKPNLPELVTLVRHVRLFPRAGAQRALFTMGSQLGVDHDALLENLLSAGEYGQITIEARAKKNVLSYLKQMGIDAVSLQHAGADREGLRIAWELEQKRNPPTANTLPTASKAHN